MIWAITGKSFSRYYTKRGADCVISDPSPFLLALTRSRSRFVAGKN